MGNSKNGLKRKFMQGIEEKRYTAIFGRNEFVCLQLILSAWIKNMKLTVITHGSHSPMLAGFKSMPFLKKYIDSSIEEYNASLGDYKGLWYEASAAAVDLTTEFYNKELKNRSKIIDYYNKILHTNKFDAFIKSEIANEIFALLKDLNVIRLSPALKDRDILITKTPLHQFVFLYMKTRYGIEYKVRWIKPKWGLLALVIYYLWLSKEIVRRGFVLNKMKKEFKLSVEAADGFHRKTLRSDMAVDNKRFGQRDILMMDFYSNKDPQRVKAFKEAEGMGYEVAVVPKLKINLNKDAPGLLFFYLLVPAVSYLRSLLSPQSYIIYYMFLFHKRCFPIEILLNLYKIKCHISTKDWGDIEETIIFNKYGTKNTILHWSDLTLCKMHSHAFIAHNVYFAWGDIYCDYYSDSYSVDSKINVGCIYKEEINKAAKEKDNIISRIKGLKRGRKIVSFFDTSFSADSHFNERFFMEYIKIVKSFCEENKDVNVLLKPKNDEGFILANLHESPDEYKKIRKALFNYDNFHYLDPLKWGVEEVIAISEVCISMGMTTPSTLALIYNRSALYFDNTGNEHNPLVEKYKNIIVFEDRDLLFKQIKNILNGRFSCRDVITEQEIRRYDAFLDNNAMERVRENLYEFTSSNSK